MAWGAAATGTPQRDRFDRSGALADAGVARRARLRRGARSWCSTWRVRRATTGRPRVAAGTATTAHAGAGADGRARSRRAHAVGVPPRRAMAQSGAAVRRLLPRAHVAVGDPGAARLPAGPGRRLGARRLHQWHRPGAAGVAARHHQAATTAAATTSREHYARCAARTEEMLAGIEPLVETGFIDDADVVVVAFGTPAKYVRAAVAPPARRRCAGRVRAPDHAAALPERRHRPAPRPARGSSASTRTTRARWSTTSASPSPARRPSSSSAASASTARGSASRPISTAATCATGSRSVLGMTIDRTDVPTDAAAHRAGARLVDDFTPR